MWVRGVTCFKFQDDTFTIRLDPVQDLADKVTKAFTPGQIHTRMNTRVNRFPPEIIQPLKAIGCEIAAFGIESGSQKILDKVRKGTTVQQSVDALKLAHDNGIGTLGLFVFGLPGETAATVYETIEYWARVRPYMDQANLAVFVPYPGSDIAERPAHYGMSILDRDWNKYWIVQKKSILALPHDMSLDDMLKLKDLAFKAFAELGYAKPDWEHDK